MVTRRTVPAAISLLLILIFAITAAASAQGTDDERASLREEYHIRMNEVGDAIITDTLTYDPDWFEEYGFIFRENPKLLSRRFRADSRVGEVENFDVEVDEDRAAITVTFETPGLAYFLEDGWNLFGFRDYSPVEEGDDRVRLEGYWTINSEFTLFEAMDLEEEVIIDLPPGAQGAEFDPSGGAVKYRLPAQKTEAGNFLQRKKGLFVPAFAVLMGLSILLFLFAITRKTSPGAAPARIESQPPGYHAVPPQTQVISRPVPPPPQPGGVTRGETGDFREVPPPPAPQPSPQGAGEPVSAPAGSEGTAVRFCRKCGHPRESEEVRFCSKCGATLD